MDMRLPYSVVLASLGLIALSGCDGAGGGSTSGSGGGSGSASSGVNATDPLNDTGVTRCGTVNTNSNLVDCSAAIYIPSGGGASSQVPHPQDGDNGRDTTDNDNSDGTAGFHFTKLDGNGDDLPSDATQAVDGWDCTRDEVTGLTWEVKELSLSTSPRYFNNTFSWYSTDTQTNGGDAGTADGGSCSGSADCDTQSLVDWVNDNGGLCGFSSGWRLPTREELHGLMNYGSSISLTSPSIDTTYFPGTSQGASQTTLYWSGSTYALGTDKAWRAYYGDPQAPLTAEKSIGMRVRLVHD